MKHCLARVGLEGFEQRSPHRLSGGEKRRVALAGVLACEPRVLVLDEPTSNLDPRGRREFKALLKTLPATKIIATHDLELVLELCPRTLVIDGGQLVAQGPTARAAGRRAADARPRPGDAGEHAAVRFRFWLFSPAEEPPAGRAARAFTSKGTRKVVPNAAPALRRYGFHQDQWSPAPLAPARRSPRRTVTATGTGSARGCPQHPRAERLHRNQNAQCRDEQRRDQREPAEKPPSHFSRSHQLPGVEHQQADGDQHRRQADAERHDQHQPQRHAVQGDGR